MCGINKWSDMEEPDGAVAVLPQNRRGGGYGSGIRVIGGSDLRPVSRGDFTVTSDDGDETYFATVEAATRHAAIHGGVVEDRWS